MRPKASQVLSKSSVIAQLAKQAAYKEALNPALLGAGLGGLLGGAGGAFINPGVDENGKKRSRLRNALIGSLGGAGLGGVYGYYNTIPDLKEEDLGIRTRPGEDRKDTPSIADPLEPSTPEGTALPLEGTEEPTAVNTRLVPDLLSREAAKYKDFQRNRYVQNVMDKNLADRKNLRLPSYKYQALAAGLDPNLRMTPTPGGRANPFEVGNAPISSFKDQASAMGVNPNLRMAPTPGGRANPFEVGNAPISSFKDQASAMGVNPNLRMTLTPGGRANPFEVGNADITPKPTPNFSILDRVLAQKPNSASVGAVNKTPADILESGLARVRNSQATPSFKNQAIAAGLDPNLRMTAGGRANPFEVGNADITPRPTPNFSILDRVLAQKPNSAGTAPTNSLESGLARVRSLPPVEFNRPTQLPRQIYQPDVLESGLSSVRNLPPTAFNRPTQLPRQAYQPSGSFSLANPSIGGPSFATPFDVRNLAPQLNPPPVYTASTQDNFNQTVRPHLVQGLNQLLQNGRVANRMRPNARNVIMDYVTNNR